MPLFDIKCKRCNHIKEVIIPVYKKAMKMSCDFCSCITWWETQAPLVSMQPDNMWAGHMVHGKHITSKSFLNRYEKQNHLERVDRSILDEVRKKSEKRMSNVIQQSSDNIGKFLEKELSGVEISNDGNTVKEQNKFNKARS